MIGLKMGRGKKVFVAIPVHGDGDNYILF